MPASSASAPVRPREVRDKRGYCTLEKARYVASRTQTAHDARSSSVHVGIFCDQEGLGNIVDKVKGLLSQGQSIQAIWLTFLGSSMLASPVTPLSM